MAVYEQLTSLVKEARRRLPELTAAAVVSSDGLIMAADLPADTDEDLFAATHAALLSVGERVSVESGVGPLEEIVVSGKDGKVVLMSAGPNAILVGVVPNTVKLGLLLVELRRTASQIARVV